MRVKVWGARGSVPAPGPQMNRYGGNTSCVQLTLANGEELIIDAGTGIRALGVDLAAKRRIHILLTHLHLDHIQGLMFFPPCFRPEAEITIWGPASPEASLEDRIARYISAPLSPVEMRDLPCSVAFRDAPVGEWDLGGATIRSEAVTHRGPTLGYRIADADGTVLCYISDHEPALATSLRDLEPEWISGYDLARGADLLIHDAQYTDEEYPDHVGWGHSAVSDALTFGRRVDARRLVLFHHDPLHSDDSLDALHAAARARWADLGGDPAAVEMGIEGSELEVSTAPSAVGASAAR
ncbi:MAG TPA: MBL fold metallo-hydrolase [Solirubrobacterales bacterium]|nr:MBL fold metallo-hydrolase [Solirubrobacterales bacterium]